MSHQDFELDEMEQPKLPLALVSKTGPVVIGPLIRETCMCNVLFIYIYIYVHGKLGHLFFFFFNVQVYMLTLKRFQAVDLQELKAGERLGLPIHPGVFVHGSHH